MSKRCIVIYRDTIRKGTTKRKPGFKYQYASNKRILSKEQIKKIEKQYIPHSWEQVEIYLNHPKLIATGELNGVVRYLYRQKYTQRQHNKKYKRLYEFGKKLPKIQQDIINKLNSRCPNYDKVVATALWFLSVSYIRVGNEQYMKENNTHGLLTLKKKHIKIGTKTIYLNFVGKKSVKNKIEIPIPNSAFRRWLIYLYDHTNPFYFHYEGSKVSSRSINQYIQETYGENFTAKDFRTWGANIELLKAMKSIDQKKIETKRSSQSALKSVIQYAAGQLNNTASVCKSNYICKEILEKYNKNPIEFVKMTRKFRSIPKLLLDLLK